MLDCFVVRPGNRLGVRVTTTRSIKNWAADHLKGVITNANDARR